MPIIVRHEPDPQILADLGYQIGQGQAIQEQEERDFRERQAAQGMMSNFISQRIAQDEMARRQQIGIAADDERQRLGFSFDQKLAEQKWAEQLKMDELNNQQQRERDAQQNKWQQDNAILAGTIAEDRSQSLVLRKGIQDLVTKMKGRQYNPNQQQSINKFMSDYDEIMGKITTKEVPARAALEGLYRQALGLSLMEGTEPMTTQQEIAQNVYPYTYKDAQGSHTILVERAADGTFRVAKDPEAARKAADEKNAIAWWTLASNNLKGGDPSKTISADDVAKEANRMREIAMGSAPSQNGPTAPRAPEGNRPRRTGNYTLDVADSYVNPGPWSGSYGGP